MKKIALFMALLLLAAALGGCTEKKGVTVADGSASHSALEDEWSFDEENALTITFDSNGTIVMPEGEEGHTHDHGAEEASTESSEAQSGESSGN